MRFIKYIITATVPVILAWMLGFIKLPETTYYLDYSVGSSKLLDLNDELKKDVKVLVGSDEKDQLSLYSVHFINKTGKHFGQSKITFKFNGIPNGSELIASSLQGPENYPDSSIIKKFDGSGEVIYSLDYINRAGDQARNYFTASFLFSGKNPANIEPISHEQGLVFRHTSQNTRDVWIVGFVSVSVILAYIWFLWWANMQSNIKLGEKKRKYHSDLLSYLTEKYDIDSNKAKQSIEEIEAIRDKRYKPPGFIKSFLRKMVEEP